MLPLGLGLSVSAYLGGGATSYLLTFAGAVLLLLPILNLAWHERRWEDAGIDYSTEIRFDVWQVAVLVVIAALILAMVTPNVSIPRLLVAFWKVASQPLQTIEDLFFRFFGNVEPVPQPEVPVPGGEGKALSPPSASLPRAHLLGGDADLTNQVVMVVCTDDPPPPPEELLMEGLVIPGPKRYWKGITYDTYTGQRWANRASQAVEIPAHEPVIESIVTPTLPLRQRFLIQAPHGYTLYATAEAARVDQRIESRQRTPGDLVGLEGRTDDYVVFSEIPQASARQLIAQSPQHISTTVPSYVVDRYLRLPDELPERVHALAQEIVTGVDSTYERALAIESYLRQFPYDLNVPTPPPGRDVVDYFLFDAQRGYCDYYGSAFVVLARAAGIPARLAIGYLMGVYDADLGCYVVAERNAHSWPEVYFHEYGWIAFEPTAAYATLTRPADPILPATPNLDVQPPPERPLNVTLREWWRRVQRTSKNDLALAAGVSAAGVTAILLLTSLIGRALRARGRRRLPPVEGVALCYAEMSLLGERLGAARRPRDTPAEYASVLSAAIQARVARWPWTTQKIMPQQALAAHDSARLSQAYQRASYYPQSISPQERARVDQLWQRLRKQLRRLAVASRAPTQQTE
jgi:transglutaminase-like putative cysteine protease